MTYDETIEYLYNAAPLFSNIGAGAYKEGLSTTKALDEHFGHPHRCYRTIHVAGTNGKGSVSSLLAAALQASGLRVGLYTSPHLVDFRERIRVNGQMMPRQRVVDFVEHERSFFEPLSPSFFELTTALAFLYFAEQEVDVAVVEVGLGGRLDCTNIIAPDLSVITNISFDHQQFLGNTLEQIAAEKAGIIKPGVPVVVGETNGHAAVREVFSRVASECGSTIRFADEETFTAPECELRGFYQRANLSTAMCAIDALRRQEFYGSRLTAENVAYACAHVCTLTGLRGRWQLLRTNPTVVCDAGHNEAGVAYVVSQLHAELVRLRSAGSGTLRVVFGMVGDKDYGRAAELLGSLGADVRFYITQPSCARALNNNVLVGALAAHGIGAEGYSTVASAVQQALDDASAGDFIFVGGSCYVVADLLSGALASAS